jgi:hypothetical protein
VVNTVLYTEAVAAGPAVVTRLGKKTVVVAGPGVAPGKYTEQKDVKSKFAFTVTLAQIRDHRNCIQRIPIAYGVPAGLPAR